MRVNRSLKQKVAAGAAVAVVVAGGASAAVSATGQSTASKRAAPRPAAQHGRDLSTAASYLGLSTAQLEADLQSGRTLAQVAGASSGKSAAGLIEALVAAKKARLDAAAAKLTQRVTAEVNRVGGPRGAGRFGDGRQLFATHLRLGFVAANYLGVTPAQLRSDLRSGKTLAQIAGATAGKSEAGLIQALVTARKERLAAAVAAGKLTQARENARLPKLTKRVTALVNRTFAKHGSR